MATITQENSRQIRDPMQVFFDMEASSSATITNYNVGTHKVYDATLGNVQWNMRVLADLEGEGFLLDGTAEWYEDKTPSSDNGKLGARGIVDENLSIGITLNQATPAVIVETEGVSEIRVGSSVYEVSGVDTIPAPSRNFTMVFVPDEEHGRAAVKYIYPGAKFEIRNDNLIRAELNLRCNLDPFVESLEGSDIEIQAYYQNDIGDMLRYIGDDWPILYQAGYSGEKSFVRKFYLTDATWSNHVLTIRGVDAVQKLDVTIKEGDPAMISMQFLRPENNLISEGIRRKLMELLPNGLYSISGGYWSVSTGGYAIRPEVSLRTFIKQVMNYSLALSRSRRFGYVDAGRPGMIGNDDPSSLGFWSIQEEDIGDITITKTRNVSRVVSGQENLLYNETLTRPSERYTSGEAFEAQAGEIFEVDFNGGLAQSSVIDTVPGTTATLISWTPSGATYKAKTTRSDFQVGFRPLIPSGGTNYRDNPNGMPGDVVTVTPAIRGSIVNDDASMFDPVNLMKVNRDTIEFTYKGDPRWQPFDLLKIRRTDGTTYLKTRIASINLVHEGGGTIARVVAKLMSEEELEGVNW